MDDTPNHYIGYCGVVINVGLEFGIPTHLGSICGVAMANLPPERDVGHVGNNCWVVANVGVLLELWVSNYQEVMALMLLELLT